MKRIIINTATAVETFNAYVGGLVSVSTLGNYRNYNYRVNTEDKSYVIKIFHNTERPFPNSEIFTNAKLQEAGINVKKSWVNGNISIDEEMYEFMISDYIEGETVLDRILTKTITDEELRPAIYQIADIIKAAVEIPLDRFGGIDNTGIGQFSSWKEFLCNQISFMQSDIKDLSLPKQDFLSPFCMRLLDYIEKETVYFSSITQGFLATFDINLANFLLTKDGQIVIIDTESCVSGDKLFPIGVWSAYTYGTDFYDYFLEKFDILSPLEQRIAASYSTMKALSVLINVARGSDQELALVKPWGNDNCTFFEIIQANFAKMDCSSPLDDGIGLLGTEHDVIE